ncbi:MAG: pyridoxamine 5'-phosphate oxidase family protein [Rhodospirillales bacterium]|nr:pyridoxamine 5'-phosphate oxidase family protein [Rhodospirillales bacterium]
MATRLETVTNFLESLKTPGNARADLLTEDARFMALNVNVPGRDDVMERLTADGSGKIYREISWQQPVEDGESVQIKGLMPEGGRIGGLVLTVLFDGDVITTLQSQNLPGTPMDASDIKLPAEIKDRTNNALKSKNPMLVSYVDENGQPVLSFRGSTQAFSDDQLAIWVRNENGRFLKSIQKNPNVALMYRDEEAKATYQIQGRAHIESDEATRKQVFESTAQIEQDHDFARIGVALIIDIDLVQGFAGLGPTGPIDPVHMMRRA